MLLITIREVQYATCAYAGQRDGEVFSSKKVDPNSKCKRSSWTLAARSHINKTAGLNCLPLTLTLNANLDGDVGLTEPEICRRLGVLLVSLSIPFHPPSLASGQPRELSQTCSAAALGRPPDQFFSLKEFPFEQSWRMFNNAKALLRGLCGQADHLYRRQSPQHPLQRERTIDRRESRIMTSSYFPGPISNCWVS